MFIWDFLLGDVMDQFIDWCYSQIVGFLGSFFSQMGNMGVELFDMGWVKSIVLFFSYLAWSLYVTGLVVSTFETGMEYQSGRGSVKDAFDFEVYAADLLEHQGFLLTKDEKSYITRSDTPFVPVHDHPESQQMVM